MSTPPFWALSFIYWLHLLATIAWIGSLASLSLLVLPAAHRLDDPAAYARLLGHIQKRLDPLGWACLLLLTGTGMFQMSANPNYQGFLSISNRWTVAILIKHLLFFGMAGVSALLTWGVLPALARAAVRLTSGLEAPDIDRLRRREAALLRINLVLGVLILGLTALARAS